MLPPIYIVNQNMLGMIINLAQRAFEAFTQLAEWITQPIILSLTQPAQAFILFIQGLTGRIPFINDLFTMLLNSSPATIVTNAASLQTILIIGIMKWVIDILP